MQKSLCILLFFFLTQVLHAQPVIDNYNQWLSSSPLYEFLTAESFNKERGKLVLSTNLDQSDPKEVRRQYATWDSLYQSQKLIGVDVSELLMLHLAQHVERSIGDLRISIRSAIPILFSVEIKVQEGEIITTVEYVDSKGVKYRPYELSTGGFDPKEYFVFKRELKEVQTVVEKVIKDLFHLKYEVDREKIEKKVLNTFQNEYIVSGKGFLTGKYFEQVKMVISCIALGEGGTEVIYELTAAYASGIIEPGEFRDLKNEYFEELMALNKKLKEALYKTGKSER